MQNNQLVPFESAKVPATLGRRFKVEDNIGASAGGFPTLSIKGKVFTINRGGEKTLVTQPDSDGAPAPSLEVVILAVHPEGRNNCRTFYAEGYQEGVEAKPTCMSNDGEKPGSTSLEPQAKSCALCAQNVVGSGATQQNPKAKACKSSKLLAVVPIGQLNDPMMIRVPGGSLEALTTYRTVLQNKKAPLQCVATRIGFDYSVAHPALTFKPSGFLTPEMEDAVFETSQGDIVAAITGKAASTAEDEFSSPPVARIEAPKAATPVAKKPAPAAVAAPTGDDDLPAAPRTAVKVEAAPAKKTAPAPAVVDVESDESLDAALDSIDFDD